MVATVVMAVPLSSGIIFLIINFCISLTLAVQMAASAVGAKAQSD
jgi:hypothetical protein